MLTLAEELPWYAQFIKDAGPFVTVLFLFLVFSIIGWRHIWKPWQECQKEIQQIKTEEEVARTQALSECREIAESLKETARTLRSLILHVGRMNKKGGEEE